MSAPAGCGVIDAPVLRFGSVMWLVGLLVLSTASAFASPIPTTEAPAADTQYCQNFELFVADWSVEGGVWGIGEATAGPAAAHSGSSCAGTNLSGNYPNSITTRLISPQIALAPLAPGQRHLLKFWQWTSISSYDAGYVQVRQAGETTWHTVGEGMTWVSSVWTQACLDLSAYAGSTVQVAFMFTSNSFDVSTGWYVDDVCFITGVSSFVSPETFNTLGDWNASNGLWEFGVPTAGPPASHGGTKCAGTILAGDYPNQTSSRLESPPITLRALTGNERHVLRFWQWTSISSYDGGYVQIRVADTGAWQTIGDAMTSVSPVWTQLCLDLSAYAGMTVRVGFLFATNSFDVSTGWYIDDLAIETSTASLRNPEDFEAGPSVWSASNGLWEIGVPTAGPASTRSGSNCVGTILGGNYPNSTASRLESPPIFLRNLTAGEKHLLKLWQWTSISSYDAGQIQIKAEDSSNWQTISEPINAYSPVWTQTCLDVSAYAGSTVRIGFLFATNSFDVSTGWYIDDLLLETTVPKLQDPEGFESGPGDWSASNGLWEIGTPTAGPATAHTGSKCAGTILGGNYPNSTSSRLESIPFRLPSHAPTGEHFFIKWWHWYSLSSYDNGYVQARVDGGSWQSVGPSFAGTSGNWRRDTLSLDAYAGSTIQLGFLMAANSFDVSTGWYIDDIRIYGLTPCCQGVVGNINEVGIVDLSDLSALILYITSPFGTVDLPCPTEANVNKLSIVDLSDLSLLICYLTGGKCSLPTCP